MKSNGISLTVFQGRAGEHNNLAMPAAAAIGEVLSRRLGLQATVIGTPEPALNTHWQPELSAALPELKEMAACCEAIFGRKQVPLTVQTRCTVSLATLPVIARHRPDAKVIWLDAHGDLHTPQTTASGYIGGMVLAGAAGLWDSGLGSGLDLANVILVDGRDIDPAEQALVDAGRVRLVPSGPGLADRLLDAIAGSPVYVHFDCDALEPGIVPADYKHEGGLTLDELRAVSEALAQNEVIGLEIAEFENAWTPEGPPVSPIPLLNSLQPLLDRLSGNTPR